MKRLIIFSFVLVLILVSIAGYYHNSQARTILIMSKPPSSAEWANMHLALDVEGTGGNDNKVYESVSASWIGTITGTPTFGANDCANDGMEIEADTSEYLLLSAAEVAALSITEGRKGTIEWEIDWNGDAEDTAVFHTYTAGAKYVWVQWDNSPGQWYIRIDDGTNEWIGAWASADPVSGTCACYRLTWDLENTGAARVKFYKGADCDNLSIQTITSDDTTTTLGTFTPGGINTGIGSNYTGTVSAEGHISNFRWDQEVVAP